MPLPLVTPQPGQPGPDAIPPSGHREPARQGHVAPRDDSGCTGTTYVATTAYAENQPDILLIMVDQMRAPRWLTSGQAGNLDSYITPNIYGLSQGGFTFVTDCTPSRATLLTGLYSQQTFMFATQAAGSAAPSLNTGYPTIGTVLRQSLPVGSASSSTMSTPYDTAWIGKWHLSALDGDPDGLTNYGFVNKYTLPNTASGSGYSTLFPSPNGMENEGNGGEFLDLSRAQTAYASESPTFPCESGHTCPPAYPAPRRRSAATTSSTTSPSQPRSRTGSLTRLWSHGSAP
ncbi:MAG TPA: sulfatase-like hydrolase/transferase [Bryobacteraceae bacterium]|nr:sulfatase-like hydrolase/transferase [Bryobacteraceae bacterium]